MRAPTHASFGILFILGIGLLLGITINPAIAAFAVLGALLPDIDTEKSAMGSFFRAIAVYIERKSGHRQATHSLLALFVLGLITAPLIFLQLVWWIALLAGYLSHLFIDATNKSGVPLFYPSGIRAVMPRAEKYRIAVGSKAEHIFFGVIVIIVFAIVPINRIGMFRLLHRIINDTQSAITDYRSWSDSHRVYALVRGTFNISQQPIVSQFQVLGIENRNTLIVYDERADKIYTVGTDEDANIYPKKIHCVKGEPITIITKKVQLKYELLGNLVKHIPVSGQTFIKGNIKTADKVIMSSDPNIYEIIRPGMNSIELRYARKRDFENVVASTIFALTGEVYLRTILPVEATTHAVSYQQTQQMDAMGRIRYAAFNPPHSETIQPAAAQQTTHLSRVHPVEMSIHNVRNPREILIREGEYIKAGQLIACLSYNDQKLTLQEQTIQRQISQLTNKPIDSHSLFLASQKVKAKQREYELQGQIFKATRKLYDTKAISKTAFAIEQQKLAQKEAGKIEAEEHFQEVKEKLEWNEKQRQYSLDQALLKLNGIQHEREQNRIYSAVNARVLLIRTQAINDNNLTIAIKLLVNAPKSSPPSKTIPKPQIEPLPIPKETPKKDNSMVALKESKRVFSALLNNRNVGNARVLPVSYCNYPVSLTPQNIEFQKKGKQLPNLQSKKAPSESLPVLPVKKYTPYARDGPDSD